uniref:Integrase catalytic domain-containing protein n=1 Tax=Maylandia zebra TaxID=106582 RepID=A0A3P9AY47_9CICH
MANRETNAAVQVSDDSTPKAGQTLCDFFFSHVIQLLLKLLQISKEELENVLSLKTSFTEAASILSISRPTLYKLLQDYNISESKFNVISDHELDQIVSQIKTEHPNVGGVMLMGHLRSKNIVVQRWLARRVYSVPHPNFIWHIDGNHKLIRWKFVVHGAIDGYSRMLMFLQCSSNNRAETVKALFTAAVGQFGRPLHIRTDHGGENAQIWEDMRASRGESSVLMGSSVHNQRAPIFYELESLGILDLENATDLFSLHYVFLPRINRTLKEFKAGYNNHSISTEGNRTPIQLFSCGTHVSHRHNPELSTAEVSIPSLSNSESRFVPLNDSDLQELYTSIHPFEEDNNNGKTLFQRTQQYIFNKLVNV